MEIEEMLDKVFDEIEWMGEELENWGESGRKEDYRRKLRMEEELEELEEEYEEWRKWSRSGEDLDKLEEVLRDKCEELGYGE